ncbi:MAG: heparinase II/III family protein [Chthonomonadetes bacterium]|nr:heparinase II/III family protein [Chthonomonadetes bacterium]
MSPSPLSTLRRSHPRLFVHRWDEVRARVAKNTRLREWRDALRQRAAAILQEPVSRYEIPDGLRLLATSQRVKERAYVLALMYRLEGDPRYVERLWQDVQSAGQFPDWNPRHFLDTAEMTHAFAVAYDWLYDVWSEEQSRFIHNAILQKGLEPGLKCYRGEWGYGGWVKASNNWNQVCNGGLTLGALAIADEAEAVAGEVVTEALRSLPLAMASYAPDGAWVEGPAYWNYATAYTVAMLAGLQSALGSDFGLSRSPGFDRAGLFPIYMTAPSGRVFNFADCGETPMGGHSTPHFFWLAKEFRRPEYAWFGIQHIRPVALHLVWGDVSARSPKQARLPLNVHFRGVEVVALRTAWEDPSAIYVGFKAGLTTAPHSNLDVGSFVMEAIGQRWAIDLGADDYNLPGYFGNLRWTYYRLRAEGHNTLVINPSAEPDQTPGAMTHIVRFSDRAGNAFAVADLTSAYQPAARRVWRGVRLIDDRAVLIQDEVELVEPGTLFWFLHTRADVTLDADGRQAELQQGGTTLRVHLLQPSTARLRVMDAKPLPSSPNPARQADNKGVRKLAIELNVRRPLRLRVLLEPLWTRDFWAQVPEETPLTEW